MKKTLFYGVFCCLVLVLPLLFFNCTNGAPMKDEYLIGDTLQAKFFLEKGDQLRGSNPDSCRFYYNQAILQLQKLPPTNRTNHLSSLGNIGIAALNCNMGNYAESEKYLAIALSSAQKTGDLAIQAQAANIKGLLHYNQSEYDSAVVCYNEAMSLASEVGNKKLQAKICTNMAIINYLKGDCNNAIESFAKTLRIAQELNDIDLITGT